MLPVARVGGFDAHSHITDAATADAVRRVFTGIPVLGGARSHFTELNREQHRIPAYVDGLTFAVTPLFHDLDTTQLIESIAVQRLVAEQAVTIAAGRPVHVGPVTLRPRFNNVATTTTARATPASDPRQADPMLAAWTVASAAALSTPGVAGISYFEQWGPRGVHGLPVADALNALGTLTGTPRLWGDSPDGLIWAVGAGATILTANLDMITRTVTVVAGADRLTATVGPLQWRALPRPSAGPAHEAWSNREGDPTDPLRFRVRTGG